MRADSLAGQIIAVVSRRAPVFQLSPADSMTRKIGALMSRRASRIRSRPHETGSARASNLSDRSWNSGAPTENQTGRRVLKEQSYPGDEPEEECAVTVATTSNLDLEVQSAEDGRFTRTVAIALIGFLAALAAAIFPLLTAGYQSPGSPPSWVSPSPGDPCDLERLSDYWNQPASTNYNESIFSKKQRPVVYAQVGSGGYPEISVKGSLGSDFQIPPGQVLYLVRRPDAETNDTFGNPGNGRYYPAAHVVPTADGCWEDDNRSLGYPGAKGIGQDYMLVLVSRSQAAKFPADRAAKGWDGYSASQWRAIDATDVMSFYVATA
ncbi:hypothetical protein ABT052_28870 [Streptomyces sp. NPDC002766]|uniref:hypothetical protein n=1 Tax=Streptomyces sp. NPDC002766 TaxID=3154429 RepID=UPI0033230D79